MPKVNKTKYALLGVLTVMPGSGYDIKKFCDYSISHFWNENYARIYPVLKEMEREGLVDKSVEQNEGRPQKNIYSITPLGEAELEQWLLEPAEETPARCEFLLKLFFADRIPRENLLQKIAAEKLKNEKLLEVYNQKAEHLAQSAETNSHKNLQLWLAAVNYGRCNAQASIRWCDETLESLKEEIIL